MVFQFQRLTLERQKPFGRFKKPGDDLQQCGLSTTTRSDEADKLPVTDVEVGLTQSLDPLSRLVVINLRNAGNLQQFHHKPPLGHRSTRCKDPVLIPYVEFIFQRVSFLESYGEEPRQAEIPG